MYISKQRSHLWTVFSMWKSKLYLLITDHLFPVTKLFTCKFVYVCAQQGGSQQGVNAPQNSLIVSVAHCSEWKISRSLHRGRISRQEIPMQLCHTSDQPPSRSLSLSLLVWHLFAHSEVVVVEEELMEVRGGQQQDPQCPGHTVTNWLVSQTHTFLCTDIAHMCKRPSATPSGCFSSVTTHGPVSQAVSQTVGQAVSQAAGLHDPIQNLHHHHLVPATW